MSRLDETNRVLGNGASDPARWRAVPASPTSGGPATGSAFAHGIVDPAWHDLVAATADFAFETDCHGRFVFVAPDPALGWTAESLLARPAELLLAEQTPSGQQLNPFRPLAPIRAGRAWLRRAEGGAACLSVAAAPIVDHAGRILGARGFGFDVTDDERRQVAATAGLRRLEIFDDMLWRLRQEVLPSRMIAAALSALAAALEAEGAAIVGVGGDARVRHLVGSDAAPLLAGAHDLLAHAVRGPVAANLHGYQVFAAPCFARFRSPEALVAWRARGGSRWSPGDCDMVASASGIIRVVLEHEAVQQELASQLRNDPLTGLLNRHAFMDELARRIDRLEREDLPGTLLVVDIDDFTRLNERAGLEAGDAALRAVAMQLRATFRPADLLARLGCDEFAVWLDGADHLAAAERAEALRPPGLRGPPREGGGDAPCVSFSIGIGTRWPGSGEEIESLMWRVDLVLRETKRNARGRWGVSRPED